jgi:ABC-type antimicrobial peptide transport system permease subunit
LILPEGTRQFLNIEVGKPNLKLCNNNRKQCYKTRVVALANKFPGMLQFSSFPSISYLNPDSAISRVQMDYLIKDSISGYPLIFPKNATELTEFNIPMEAVFIDLAENVTQVQKIALQSEVQTQLDIKKSIMMDYQRLTQEAKDSVMAFVLFFDLVIALLLLLAFFQLLLSIEANFKENKWEIGVLRSMGMSKAHIQSLT